METAAAKKKARFSSYNLSPPVVVGFTAHHAGAYNPFSIFPSTAEPADFLPANARRCDDIDISEDCMNGLCDPDLSESQQRDKIYAEFKRHGIVVPEGTCMNALLFKDIAKDDLGLPSAEPLKRIEQELVVTSKPGLSSVISQRDLKLGVFQHAPQYNQDSSYRQGFLYMHAWMYHLRVQQGLPVNTVYGFGFCGHKCSDNYNRSAKKPGRQQQQHGEYSVGLFQLTAPVELDKKMNYRCAHHWEKFSTSDANGVKMLVRFLKYGNESDLASPTVIDLQKPPVDRRPCLYCLPQKYWQDDPPNRILVKNGSKAIVFYVTLQVAREMWQLLSIDTDELEEFDEWAMNEPNEAQRKRYYVKIRTTDMHPAALSNVLGENLPLLAKKDPTFSELYPVRPMKNAGYVVALMNDKGSRVTGEQGAAAFANFSELQTLFRDLKKRTLAVSRKMQNTDALAHNLVLEQLPDARKKLHLIDWDEGALTGGIPERKQDRRNAGQSKWFAFLMYPNSLRLKRADWYTRVQLAAALIALVSVRDDLSQQHLAKLERIISTAESASRELAILPVTKDDLETKNVQALQELDRLCDDFLAKRTVGKE